jgi:DNA (cytosine-5)-methyltransferase 1
VAHSPLDGGREERPDAGGFAAGDRAEGRAAGPESSGVPGELGNASCLGREGWEPLQGGPGERRIDVGAGATNGFWRDADWLFCRDGKWRPAKSCLKPLVVGSSSGVVRGGDPGEPIDADYSTEARVQRLRGYGNAIVAPVAEAFIRAYMDTQAR